MSNRDPEGRRLPVRIDSTSNGEFAPRPLTRRCRQANALAQEWAGAFARRRNMGRRAFMVSLCGAASTLLACNQVNRQHGRTGGAFDLPQDAALDEAAAAQFLEGEEFIFDVQGHYVNPTGAWLRNVPSGARPYSQFENPCVSEAPETGREYLQCLGADEFIKDVFLDSDTDMIVLSFVPSTRDAEPVTIEEADETRRIVDAMEGDHRLMIHGRVNPNQPGDLEDMDRLATEFQISAWKTYTQWGPGGRGFFLTDDPGERMIAKAKSLGVRNIAIHKGLPFGPRSYEHSTCIDVGQAARRHPDINFILYHSGFDPAVREEAFAPGAGKAAGIDALCQSLIDAELAPNRNVYAELGSTWRYLMRDPDQAAHTLGKLIKYCGDHNVLWGTDSIWYGSPQDQIQAFRTFAISGEYQERYGYTAMTPGLRAKIFGLNGARVYGVSREEVLQRAATDALMRRKHAYRERPDPSFTTYGPRTPAQFAALRRNSADHWA